MMQQSSRFDLARLALNNSLRYGLDPDQALIQVTRDIFHIPLIFLKESSIVTDSGQINKAIMLLEPAEFDIYQIQEMMKKSKSQIEQISQSKIASLLGCQDASEERLHLLAQRLLLSAKLMSTSHTRHGKSIIERYKLALELHPRWEEAAFELGQYYHTLVDILRTELVNQRNSSSDSIHTSEVYDDKYLSYSINALDAYLKTITFGHKHLMQALSRLLTLWFSVTGIGRYMDQDLFSS